MITLEHLYCYNCGWRIVIGGDRKIMWAEYAVIIGIGAILFQFIVPRNIPRAFFLFALWLFFVFIVDIVTALIVVNVARFSKPDVNVSDEEL